MNDKGLEWIYVKVQSVGNLDKWGYSYYSDLRRFPSRRGAIGYGIRTEGHDDFLIAGLQANVLVKVGWQYEDQVEEDGDHEVSPTSSGSNTRLLTNRFRTTHDA